MNAPTFFGDLKVAQDVTGLSCAGYGGVAIQATGTFVGTLSFEGSTDNENFRALLVTPSNSATQVSSSTGVGLWFANVTGLLTIRVRMSAYTSGTASVRLKASESSPTAPPGSGGGGGGGTSSNFGDPFPATGTASGFIDNSGNMAGGTLDASGYLKVNVAAGGGAGGTSSTFGAAFPATGTAIGVADPDGNMHALSAETFDFDTGAGSAPVSALGLNIPASGGPLPVLGGHGTAAQALRVELPTDGTGVIATVGAVTAITNALPAGSNVIGHVISDSGSTTAVTGITNALKWKAAGASGGTVLTTELNALANGAYSALGSEINNSTGLHTYGWLDVVLASLNPTTGAALTLFMCPAYDGTNYPDAPSATNPGAQFLVQTIYVATGSAAKRVGTATFRLPPFKVKFVLLNSTNVALGATSNTVTLYTSEQGF